MTGEEERVLARAVADEVTAEIKASQDESTAAARKEQRRDGAFWLAMVATAVIGPALAILFSAYNTNRTELKFCALMEVSVTQAEDRLAGYIEAPPTTDAGRAQQENAADSVRILTQLQRSLGCPSEEGKP